QVGAAAVTVAVRRASAADELVALGERLGLPVEAVRWPDTYKDLPGADLVVSTTPAGATDPLAATGWPDGVPLLDVLYAPWPTRLAEAAAIAGSPAVGGLAMLVGQAAEQVQLMTGRPA